MAKIRIRDGEHKNMFIKTIDKVNCKLEFTNDINEAYERDGGFYVNSEIDFLKFHFADEYPDIVYAFEYDCY